MDRVLIVDDNPEILESLKEGLTRLNQFEVLTASDGEMALEVLRNEFVSLLVTDVVMPRMDGLEL